MPSDLLAQEARMHHRAAQNAAALAERHRRQRDDLVRRLRAADPATWTYPALAGAVGCSPELIAAILHGRTGGKARRRGGPENEAGSSIIGNAAFMLVATVALTAAGRLFLGWDLLDYLDVVTDRLLTWARSV